MKKIRIQVIQYSRTVCPSCERIVKLWVVVYKALKLRLFYLIYSMVGLYFALRTYKVLSVIRWEHLTGCLYPSSQNVDTQSDPQCYMNTLMNIISLLKKKKLSKGILKRRRKACLQSIERDAMKDRKVQYKMFRSLNHIEVNIFVLKLFFFTSVSVFDPWLSRNFHHLRTYSKAMEIILVIRFHVVIGPLCFVLLKQGQGKKVPIL